MATDPQPPIINRSHEAEGERATMYVSTTDVTREFRRVFGSDAWVEECGSNMLVLVTGWPDRVEYDGQRAYDTLLQFPDGMGFSVEGDAEVCKALEDSGAFIRLDR